MLDIVVCEDNVEYRRLITEIINAAIEKKMIDGRIVLACDSVKEVISFMHTNKPNVFFLDIELNSDQTGYDLAILIKEMITRPYIVFISQHINFVFKSFKVRAFDFLPKPVSRTELENVLINIYTDYLESNQSQVKESISVKIGAKIYNIPKDEIVMIEKYGNRCVFYSESNTIYCYETLETISKKLESSNFIRCHRSFIVNKTFIKEINISDMEIILTNGQKCYIGGKYKKNLIANISIE